MKRLIAVMMMLFIATGALASNWVDWKVDTGYFKTPPGGSYYGDVGVGQSVLWALIYTAGASYGTATASDLGGGMAQVNLTHTIVDYRYFAAGWANQADAEEADLGGAPGLSFDAGLYVMSGSTELDKYEHTGDQLGSVYMAVFANVAFDGATITFTGDGINYTFDALTTLSDITPGGAVPAQPVIGANGAGVQVDSYLEGYPAVPEPATMSLLGLGALVMAIRRRRS